LGEDNDYPPSRSKSLYLRRFTARWIA
jgi:hypothetical protein